MKNKIEATRNSLILTAYKTYSLEAKDIAKIFRITAVEAMRVIKARTLLDKDVHEKGN